MACFSHFETAPFQRIQTNLEHYTEEEQFEPEKEENRPAA